MERFRHPTSTIICPSDTLLIISRSISLLVVLQTTVGLEQKCYTTQLAGDIVSKVRVPQLRLRRAHL